MTFGQKLSAARHRAGLTQDALATRLGHARASQISMWENNSRMLPEPSTVVRLAKALGCSSRDLLVDVETPYDRLRGATATSEPLRSGEGELLRVWRTLPRAMQRRQLALMTEIAKVLAPVPATAAVRGDTTLATRPGRGPRRVR